MSKAVHAIQDTKQSLIDTKITLSKWISQKLLSIAYTHTHTTDLARNFNYCFVGGCVHIFLNFYHETTNNYKNVTN